MLDVLSDTIRLGNATLYPQQRCLYLSRKRDPLFLRRQETDLLEALALCEGTMVTNEMLVAVVYGRYGRRVAMVTLRSLVYRLRAKLARVCKSVTIYQIRGYGYKLVLQNKNRTSKSKRGFLLSSS